MSFDKGMKWIKKHKVKSYRPREVSLVMQTAHQRSMEALRRQIQAADSLEDLIAD